MRRRGSALALSVATLVCAFAPQLALAQRISDRVRTDRGTETGEVTDMTPVSVSLAKGSAGTRSIAVNEIRSIVFDDEPSELSQARVNAANGGYSAALTALERINSSEVERAFVTQEVEFYWALVAAKLALGGSGEITDAGRQLSSFVRSHPQNFHYLEAVETMGDLLAASGKYASAERQYAELSKAPWPEYKMRAAVLRGRMLQEQKKHAEAIGEFGAALAMPGNGPNAKSEQLAATLGKAVSLAETGSLDDAVRTIEDVIRNADPEEAELHARAYNALGRCYERGGKTKDALLAFLHVDLLYSSVPDAHAEALSHLVPLWQAIGQDERSREARQLLQDRYGNSRWAK